jgi:hypothetical protein
VVKTTQAFYHEVTNLTKISTTKKNEEIMFNYREKIVDVWYLGTNQNGNFFELLTANP